MKKSIMKKLFIMFLALGTVGFANASVIWHYTLDETAGTTAGDSAGSYNGALVNATGTPAFSFNNQSVAGKYGNALSFRGPSASNGNVGDDYINVTIGDSALPAGGSYANDNDVSIGVFNSGTCSFIGDIDLVQMYRANRQQVLTVKDGDLNYDSIVDFSDLAVLLQNWLSF